MKCPKGHDVGNVINGVSCGPDMCADTVRGWDPEKTKAVKRKPKSVELPIPHAEVNKEARLATKELKGADLEDELALEANEQLQKMKKAIGKYEARKAYIKPADTSKMTQEETKDYVNKRLESLAPEALSRIEFDLKLGDDDASRKAAYEVLDRTGFGRKEGGGLPGAPIIIVTGAPSEGTTTTTYKPAWMVDAKKEEKK